MELTYHIGSTGMDGGERLTYWSCAVNDGRDSRKGPGIALEALVCSLGSKVKTEWDGIWGQRQTPPPPTTTREDYISVKQQWERLTHYTLTRSAATAVVIRAYGPFTSPPHTSSIPMKKMAHHNIIHLIIALFTCALLTVRIAQPLCQRAQERDSWSQSTIPLTRATQTGLSNINRSLPMVGPSPNSLIMEKP